MNSLKLTAVAAALMLAGSAYAANAQIYPRLAAARLKKRESRSPTRGCGFLSFFR